MSAALAMRSHGGELRIPIRGGATKTVKTSPVRNTPLEQASGSNRIALEVGVKKVIRGTNQGQQPSTLRDSKNERGLQRAYGEALWIENLLTRIQVNNPLNRPPAHGAEVISPCEHDAVDLRPVVTLRFIDGTFERPDTPVVLLSMEHRLFVLQLFAKECFHHALRKFLLPDLSAPLLNFARVLFKLVFVPWRGYWSIGRNEILPFEIGWIEQCRRVRLPGFDPLRRRRV